MPPSDPEPDLADDAPLFSRRFMRRARAVGYVVILLAVAVMWSTFDNAADPDLWHRLATGKIVWDEGAVPMVDRFSYRGKGGVVEDHEWLTGVLFYPLYTAFGHNIFVWVKIVLFTLILFTIAPLRRYRPHPATAEGGSGVAWTWQPSGWGRRFRSTVFYGEPDFSVASLCFICVAAFGLLPDICSTIRCHAFTMVFWAAWIVWLEQARRTGRLPWFAVIVTSIFWMNMHGGYIAGLGLLFVYGAGEWMNGKSWVPMAALGSASALASLINPYGLGMWISTVNAIFIPHPEFKSWHAPVLTDLSNPGFKILLILSIIAIILPVTRLRFRQGGALRNHRGDWVPVLVMLIAGAMSLKQQRNGGLFVICAAIFAWPWLCELSRRAAPVWHKMRRITGTSLWVKVRNISAGCAVLLIVAMLIAAAEPSGNQFGLLLKSSHAPSAVLELEKRLAARPAGSPQERLMVPFNWGSYALWKLYPQALVSMDGRYELVYTVSRYMENEDFFRARGDWQRVLKESGSTLVLAPADATITQRLKEDAGWQIIYADKDAPAGTATGAFKEPAQAKGSVIFGRKTATAP